MLENPDPAEGPIASLRVALAALGSEVEGVAFLPVDHPLVAPETVAKLVATEPDSITGIPAKERVADLLQFSVSTDYFALRKHLGFALD